MSRPRKMRKRYSFQQGNLLLMLVRNSFCLYVILGIDEVRCINVIQSRLIPKNPTIEPEQSRKIATFLAIAQDCKEEQAVQLVSFGGNFD